MFPIKFYHHTRIICLLAAILPLMGCAAVLVGAGAGASAIAYVRGKEIKTYESEYHQTVRAAADTLEQLKIPIEETVSDELKTTIKGKRPDGTPVTIDVVRLENELTEVGVRTGSVGMMNQKVSRQIIGFIDEHIARSSAAEAPPPETPAEPPVVGVFQETNLPESPPGVSTEIEDDAAAPAVLATRVFTIFFDMDREELTGRQMKTLDSAAKYISERPAASVVVNGYTDSSGDAEYNRMISSSRANVVKVYLIGKGVDAARIEVIGHGEKNFIADNNTPRGRSINRRVEIEVQSPYR